MSRMWEQKKLSLKGELDKVARLSPVLDALMWEDRGDACRAVVGFRTKTLVRGSNGEITTDGPVVVGIRYLERFVSQAPLPMEIASSVQPDRIFHPNCNPAGATCLGHPTAGLTLELILNQLWAGLTINMKVVNTRWGQIVNRAAADYVRANAHRFPLTRKGLLEAPD